MLKLHVKYETFDGNEVEEDLLFHFSQDEMLAYIRENRDALAWRLGMAVATEDYFEAYRFVRDMVVQAYGERSEDGVRFLKSDDIKANLTETPRLDAVLDKILASEKEANSFFNALIPPKMREMMEKQIDKE